MPFPIDPQMIARTEVKLGFKFSLSYVAQMCKDNGGMVRADEQCWWLYPIFDDGDRKRLKRTCNDVVRQTSEAAKWTSFPSNAVAIGANGGGDELIFLRGQDSDQLGDAVFWWDHETGELNKVADDFLELPTADGITETDVAEARRCLRKHC